jgi:hypothetical protein
MALLDRHVPLSSIAIRTTSYNQQHCLKQEYSSMQEYRALCIIVNSMYMWVCK